MFKIKFIFFCFLSFTLSVFGSGNKDLSKQDYVIFSGKIINSINPEINIFSKTHDFKRAFEVKNSNFKDTLYINKEGYFYLRINNKSILLYLKQGDSLHVSIDMDNFPKSINYSGRGALINNYFTEKRVIENKSEKSILRFTLKPSVYKIECEKQKEKKNDLLKKYFDLDNEFIIKERRYNQYDYLFDLSEYAKIYRNKKNIPNNFLEEMESIDFDNQIDFKNYENYVRLCINRFAWLLNQRKINVKYDKDFFTNEINKISSDDIRNILVKNIVKDEIDIQNPYLFETYDWLIDFIDDKDLKIRVDKYIKDVRKLAKGNISPVFAFKNNEDHVIKLEDFIGKYVFIDLWATWCKSCLTERPYFNKLQKQYKDYNIEFISISIDSEKDKDRWKKTIVKEKYNGIHLIASEGPKSKFIKDYLVDAIPRFILIGPTGKIVDATALAPSNKELIILLNDLILKPTEIKANHNSQKHQ